LTLLLQKVSADATPIPVPISRHLANRRGLLVAVGDSSSTGAPDPVVNSWAQRAKGSADERYRVMPALPAKSNPALLLPKRLRRFNVGWWTKDIRELAQAILEAAGVSDDEYRIFVSYKRSDCQALAEQLFVELSKHRFQVFVDRFTIPPGLDFQERLDSELEDKSMVLILESEHLLESDWVAHEIAFAKNRKLGVMGLRLPSGKDVPIVTDGNRVRLDGSDFKGKILAGSALKRVVARVKLEHNLALFRRRESMRKNFELAIHREIGMPPTLLADGIKRFSYNRILYGFWLTPRPPQVDDYHAVCHRGLPLPTPFTNSKLAVIGPSHKMRPHDQEQLRWLGGLCNSLQFDEQQIDSLAVSIRDGGY